MTFDRHAQEEYERGLGKSNCPTCGSDERAEAFYQFHNTGKDYGNKPLYFDSRKRVRNSLDKKCTDSWHDKDVFDGIEDDYTIVGTPTMPDDVEAALGALDHQCEYGTAHHVATLRAHIEALTAERDDAIRLTAQRDEWLCCKCNTVYPYSSLRRLDSGLLVCPNDGEFVRPKWSHELDLLRELAETDDPEPPDFATANGEHHVHIAWRERQAIRDRYHAMRDPEHG